MKLENITTVHNYSGGQYLGDAGLAIQFMKENDYGHLYFWDDDKDEYRVRIDSLSDDKEKNGYVMPHSGGGWHELFYSLEGKKKSGFYIDTACAEFRQNSWVSNEIREKKHLSILSNCIESSIKDTKPISVLHSPSKKLLLCGTSGEVEFYTTNKKYKIDYKKNSTEKIISKLFEYCWEPKCKFINYNSNLDTVCLDFFIDDLEYKTFEVYPVFASSKDIDFFAIYYATFYCDEKDLYKKIHLDEGQKSFMRDWTKEQVDKFTLEKLSDQIEDSFISGISPIQKYKRYIDNDGYLMGYYFNGIS